MDFQSGWAALLSGDLQPNVMSFGHVILACQHRPGVLGEPFLACAAATHSRFYATVLNHPFHQLSEASLFPMRLHSGTVKAALELRNSGRKVKLLSAIMPCRNVCDRGYA